MVETSSINELRKEGKILAYQFFNTWVEVRRKQSNQDYQESERRKLG